MTVRILVVDDSVVIRKLLTATLGDVPGMEVVATAALGKIALAKIEEVHPDIVILDVEMPEMDGIETLKRIRKLAPKLPVIMFSTKTDRGAAATIEALTSGASDYVSKPSNAGNVLAAMARVRDEMVPKIQALTGTGSALRPPAGRLATTTPIAMTPGVPSAATLAAATPMSKLSQAITRPLDPVTTQLITRSFDLRPRSVDPTLRLPISATTPPAARAIEIIAIGASTGGPNALSTLLAALPADLPVPIAIVQHMLPTFTRHFAQRLAQVCSLPIVEATQGEQLLPGRVYLARGDYHLVVERRAGRTTLAVNQGELENYCRPAVDVLFRSVAQVFGAAALGVVLTGMGHDGLLGCGAIRNAGGDVIVQDEATSVVWGMPGFVARAGLASQILPIEQIGPELRRRVLLSAPRALEAAP